MRVWIYIKSWKIYGKIVPICVWKEEKPAKDIDGNPLRPVNGKSAVLVKPYSPFWRGRVKKFNNKKKTRYSCLCSLYYSMSPSRFYSLLYIQTVYINTLNMHTLHNSSATIFNLKCTHRDGVDYCMSYADFVQSHWTHRAHWYGLPRGISDTIL